MKKHSGFTLIELIVTLALVGVLLTLGLPTMKSFVQGDRLVASSNELLSAIHLARSEAIKNNASVTICSSSDSANCDDPVTGWENGWIVFIDRNRDADGLGVPCNAGNEGGDCLLRLHETLLSGSETTGNPKLRINGVFAGDATDIAAIVFTSRGLPQDLNGVAQAGEFSVCIYDDSNSLTDARAVTMGLPGRVRVRSPQDITTIACP